MRYLKPLSPKGFEVYLVVIRVQQIELFLSKSGPNPTEVDALVCEASWCSDRIRHALCIH